MPQKRPGGSPRPDQLVFPFQLQVGDVILEDGARAEVVGRPTNATNGKTTRAWVRDEGATVQRGMSGGRGGASGWCGGQPAARASTPASGDPERPQGSVVCRAVAGEGGRRPLLGDPTHRRSLRR